MFSADLFIDLRLDVCKLFLYNLWAVKSSTPDDATVIRAFPSFVCTNYIFKTIYRYGWVCYFSTFFFPSVFSTFCITLKKTLGKTFSRRAWVVVHNFVVVFFFFFELLCVGWTGCERSVWDTVNTEKKTTHETWHGFTCCKSRESWHFLVLFRSKKKKKIFQKKTKTNLSSFLKQDLLENRRRRKMRLRILIPFLSLSLSLHFHIWLHSLPTFWPTQYFYYLSQHKQRHPLRWSLNCTQWAPFRATVVTLRDNCSTLQLHRGNYSGWCSSRVCKEEEKTGLKTGRCWAEVVLFTEGGDYQTKDTN